VVFRSCFLKKKEDFFKMKKIVTTIAALAMAVSMFAADFSATVQVKGDVAYGKSVDGASEFGLLGVENTNQKDNDLLELNYAGDKAGAFVRFWTVGDFADQPLNVRALKLWFEPAAGVKITLGNNELALYKEQLDWWKVPCGASLAEFGSWDGRWQAGAAFHETWGSTIEVTAIEGLYLGFGAASSFITKAGEADAVIGKWGAVAKYSINGMSFGAAFKDAGDFNLLTVGADFSKDAFYGMIEGKIRFDNTSAGYDGQPDDDKLAGITIDNYFAYNINGINIQLTAPVTLRGFLDKEDKADASYMTLRAKVTIPVDAFSVYTILGSDEGFTCGPAGSVGATVWNFSDFGGTFNFYGKVGASLNVGVCSLDLGAEFAYDKPSKTFAWAIPFTTKVAF
jgi:hypothetical protein